MAGLDDTEVVRRVPEGLQRVLDGADPAAEIAHVGPDFQWTPAEEVPGGTPGRGPDGFVDFLRQWTEDFETWTFELDRLVDAGDGRVVAWCTRPAPGHFKQ